MVTRVGMFLSLVTSVTALFQPPVIFSEPAYEVYFKSGESVQLSCVANGEPRPQYRWTRNEIAFNPSGNDARVVQLPKDGTLVFNSPEDQDEGTYQCFATNSLGTAASKKVKLIQAKLSEFAYARPRHLTPKIGEPLTLPCIPPESVPPALLIWINKHDNGGIDVYNYDSRVSMDSEFRLRFSNVRAEDRKGGVPYACVAMNPTMRRSTQGPLYYISPIGEGGEENTQAKRGHDTTFLVHRISSTTDSSPTSPLFTSLRLQKEGASLLPDAPTQVTLESCKVNATISWLTGSNNATVDYFVVEYNASFNPEKWTFGLRVNSTVNRVNFTLSPYVQYTFRVIAYNEIGASKPSNPTTKVCFAKPDRPAYNPRNLRTLGNHYGKLYVEWTPVPEYDQNGPGYYYLMRISRVGAPAETDTIIIPINDRKVNHYEMSTGYVYTPYEIKMKAGNNVGDAREDPSTIIGYSYESTPSITPTKLVAAEVGPTYVVFQWEFDRSEIGKANTTIHGEFRGFQIDLWPENETTSTARRHDIGPESANNATGNIFNARVENLLPNTSMAAQIRVKNNFYISSAAEIIRFKTLGG